MHQTHAVLLPPGVTLQQTQQAQQQQPNDSLDLKMSNSYGCQAGVLSSATTWLGIAATLLMVLLMAAKVNAAAAYGVVFATIIAWIPGVCAGDQHWDDDGVLVTKLGGR